MKKIIAIILLTLMFTSCSNPEYSFLEGRFEPMVQIDGIYYFRDTVTDVVYFKYYHELCVMVKADGTPYLWSELVEEAN
jgi:hypothetical protein